MMNLFSNIIGRTKSIGIALIVGTVLVSCHKEVSVNNQIGNTVAVNYRQTFEDYWSAMNKTYVFWSVDTTNWDNIHSTFGPLFSELDKMYASNTNLYGTVDSIAYTYFQNIADRLIDSHYTLTLDYPGNNLFLQSNPIQPAHDRKLKNPQYLGNLFTFKQEFPDYPNDNNYYTFAVDTQPKYLDPKRRMIGVDSGYPYFAPYEFYAVSGYITNTNILYFSCSNFFLTSILEDASSQALQAQNSIYYFLNQLNNPQVSSVIIDVRGNGGGDTRDLNLLVGRFVTSPLKFGYTRSKNGNGRLDYAPWADAIVSPWTTSLGPQLTFTKPIVVLADNKSVSLAEATAMSLKVLQNVTFVGDTTWGANGPLTENQIANAGSFSFGNAGTSIGNYGQNYYYGFAYTSSFMFKYINGKVYEGKGFPPDVDIKVTGSQVYLSNNKLVDPQLEKAISLLPH